MALPRLFRRKPRSGEATRLTLEPDAQWLNAARGALGLIEKRHDAGHDAYLVGGCVRDLLMQHPPKDFDIATDARPQKICRLLPRSRVVGRRFPIVLARTAGHAGKSESIEITTFRAPVDSARRQRHGLVTRDNKFGSMQDDANRRDLSVNALYFDPRSSQVVDYSGGIRDIEQRTARILGNPQKRFREDPVRILRAIRFSTRLGLKIEPDTHAAMKKTVSLLREVQAARMFDEFARPLLQANSLQSWALFRQYGVLEHCLPDLANLLRSDRSAERMIEHTLASTEKYLEGGKPANPALLYATLLWPLLQHRLERNQMRDEPLPAIKVARILLEEIAPCITIPGRFRQQLLDAWLLQPQLERRSKRALESANMPLALHLLEFRTSEEPHLGETAAWWAEQRGHWSEMQHETKEKPRRSRPKRKRRNRRRKSAQSS